MGNLYNYVFWYNEYQDLWYAIDRNTENDFFNGNREKSIYYKSKQHSTLVELLTKESVFEKYNKTNMYGVYEIIPQHGKDNNSLILGPYKSKDEAELDREKYGYNTDNYYVKEIE